MRLGAARARGLTLLEVMVAAVLLVGVVGMALATFGRSHHAVTESMLITELELDASRLEQRLRREIGNSRVTSTAGTPGPFHWVKFVPIAGLDEDGTVVTAPEREIRFVYEDDDDGNDDDDDGLVDDGRVELVMGGSRITLARNVAEDFEIVRATGGRLLTVRFTIGGRRSIDGARQVSREVVIALKNL